MARRVLDFADGFTSASAPTTGSLWNITNTYASPLLMDGNTSITPAGNAYEVLFISGDGTPIVQADNPPIGAGTNVGEMLRLVGTSDTNTVTFSDGTQFVLNGDCIMSNLSTLDLMWTGNEWIEVARNDI